VRILILLAVLCSACAYSSPTAPSTPITPTPIVPVPLASYTVTGIVTATNGGQTLSGLTVDLNGQAATTNGVGGFSYTMTSGTTARLILIGASIVPRSVTLNVASARTVAVSAIGLSSGFDLGFYRQIVRNGFETTGVLQPVRRWTRTPQIYLKTVDEAGEAIHGPTLDVIEAAAKDAVPRWTSGALGVPIVERGTGSREGVSGWITIKFPATNTVLAGGAGSCGRAQVAVDGGWMELNYHSPPLDGVSCRVAGAVIAAHVVEHEFGHALGFWHTDTPGDLMYARGSWLSPTGLPSAHELAAAAIAYARPVGNVDPDSDPTGTVSLAPLTVR
jgi:hypothetical protein